MPLLTRSLLHFLVTAAFSCGSVASLAMPKAAEHEDAPVSSGVNAARPRHSTAKPVKKPVNSAKPVKKSRTSHTRK
ncbi:hypothetical protein [Propionivibrio sp.]|uniref:hypothetical protein n=1 Tax=Propionivibrio sp. TaxID=2212460 RepID=UPI00262D89AC|nr:hypothetical protein [Propionivibrio sp.]